MALAKTVASKTGDAIKSTAEATKPVLKKGGEIAVIAKDKSIDLATKGKEELV